MSTRRWLGTAPKIAQVRNFLLNGTWEADDIIIFTIGTKSYSMAAGSTNTTTIAALMATTWNALSATSYPEFAEMTASSSTGNFILTADTAGRPFTVTISSTEANGGASDAQTIDSVASPTTSTGTQTTANSGPNDVGVAANWSGTTLPVDADDIVFDTGSVDALYNLDQNAVSPATITILPGYKGKIGLPTINSDSAGNPYYEYRETYLCYGNAGDAQACVVTIRGGAGRVKINNGTAQATWNVVSEAQTVENGIPAVLLKCTHASTALNVNKGDVGVAFYGGETSTLVTVNVGYTSNKDGDSTVYLGSGVTLTAPTITQTGGTMQVNSAITGASVVNLYAGTYYQNGTGGIAAGLTVAGGHCVYNSTGTLGGAPIVSNGGILDFSQDLRAKTVTNAVDVFGKGSSILDPNKSVGTLVVDLDQIRNADDLDIGLNIRLTRGTVA